MRIRRMPTFVDSRGVLVAVDDAALDYVSRRVFFVSGVPDGAVRGEHLVPCRQTLVVTAGSATVVLGQDDAVPESYALTEAGEAIELYPGEYVRYRVSPEGCVAVFAAEPYHGAGTAPP